MVESTRTLEDITEEIEDQESEITELKSEIQKYEEFKLNGPSEEEKNEQAENTDEANSMLNDAR